MQGFTRINSRLYEYSLLRDSKDFHRRPEDKGSFGQSEESRCARLASPLFSVCTARNKKKGGLLIKGYSKMKKTLAAVAVLGAFAGSALAADVQLYGIVDTGFQYLNADADRNGFDSTNSFSIESGMQSGSRFGIKGTEDLGNGLTVGFILENQFSSDTGALKNEDSFFHREASLFLEGGFGKVAFGRMGSINGGVSALGKYSVYSAFGTSWGNYSAQAGNWAVGAGMWDNMVAYETPNFAGFKVFAQYGMGI